MVPFQDYFVRLQHGVPIASISFEQQGCELNPVARRRSTDADGDRDRARRTRSCRSGRSVPSPGVDELLAGRRESVVAVSPIVGGHALKGPADRMMAELGVEPSVVGVARLYAPIAATLVIDTVDAGLAGEVEAAGMRCVVTPTVMSTPDVARVAGGRVPRRRPLNASSSRLTQAVGDRRPRRPAEVDPRPHRRHARSVAARRVAPGP